MWSQSFMCLRWSKGRTFYPGFFGGEGFNNYNKHYFICPLRFHRVGGCWDLTQDCCDFGIGGSQSLIHKLSQFSSTLRKISSTLGQIHPHSARPVRSNPYSARFHPHSARCHPYSARCHPHSARCPPYLARFHPHLARCHPYSASSHPHSVIFHPYSARSHPQSAIYHQRPIDVIHTRLYLINTRLDLIHTRLDLTLNRINTIDNLALSHPQLGQISSTLGQMSSILNQISSTLGQMLSTLGQMSSILGYILTTFGEISSIFCNYSENKLQKSKLQLYLFLFHPACTLQMWSALTNLRSPLLADQWISEYGLHTLQALDLCNGGMIWSCCVPKDKVLSQVNTVSTLIKKKIRFSSYMYNEILNGAVAKS